MPRLARWDIPLLVHAELLPEDHGPDESRSYGDYLNQRPDRCEEEAIDLVIRLARETDCPVHIVHLSTAKALPAIEAARAAGLRLSSETCPHYLWFEAETIAEGDTLLKCAPPIPK